MREVLNRGEGTILPCRCAQVFISVMEALTRLWRGLASIRCKRSRFDLADLPRGVYWGFVQQTRPVLTLAFDDGLIQVPASEEAYLLWEGSRVCYFSHPDFSCLTFLDLIREPQVVVVLGSFEECLVLKCFDHLDYFNLPLEALGSIEGQLEVGGCAIISPYQSFFSLRSLGRTRPKALNSLSSSVPLQHVSNRRWAAPLASSPAYPISPIRASLASLQHTQPDNSHFKTQVASLAPEIAGWRQVQGDGNCYYRAVAVAWMDHLARKSTSESAVLEFKLKVLRRSGVFAVNDGFETPFNHLCGLLDQVIGLKARNPGSALCQLQPCLQRQDFDQCLHLMLRNYCYNHIALNPDLYADFRSGQSASQVLLPGVEAEGIALLGLTDVLGVAVFHYILDGRAREVYVERYFPEKAKGQVPVVRLAYVPGHYDLLYSLAQDQVDGYSQTSHTFNVAEQFDQESLKGLYVIL